MATWLDTLFTFYLESRGWLYLLLIPSLVFIVTLIDNQRNNRGGIGWLVGMFICILAFLPAAIYDLGPDETKATLTDVRVLMFYVGVLGALVPLMLLVGYWLSTRPNPALSAGGEVRRVDGAPIGGDVPSPQVPPAGNFNGDEDSATVLQDNVGFDPPQMQQPPSPMAPSPPMGFDSVQPAPPPPANGFPPPAGPPPGFNEGPTLIGQAGGNGGPMPPPPARRGINAWLVDAHNANVRYQLVEGETVIGRGTQYDVALTDAAVSRPHAVIEQKGRSFVVRDLGSRSGTYVNGYLLEGDGQILHDTVLRIGNNEFRFISE